MFRHTPFTPIFKLSLLTLYCFFCLQAVESHAQAERKGIYLGAGYGFQWPAGDIADRFGANSILTGNVEMINEKLWVFGTSFNYMFGNNINEAIAGGLVDGQGRLINTASDIADVDVKQRGFAAFMQAGRILDLWSERHISGIKWSLGVGFLQHKVRLADSQNAVPYFEKPYVKGYDRLTNGVAVSQFIGYQFFDNRGRLNFFAGLEAIEGFTKNRRGLNYNTREAIDKGQFDMLFGFKAGIQITIKSIKDQEDIWY